MLKDIFGSLGFVIVGSDILFWAYFFIMDNTCIPFVLINDRKMIDAKHVHKLLECKYDFKHWIKDVISSFNFKDGIDYISYRYDNNGEQIIDNNSHVFRHDYYLFPKSILCIIYMKCDRSLFKDFIYDIFDCCNIKNDDRVLDIIHRSIDRYNKKCIKYFTYIIRNNNNGFYKIGKSPDVKRRLSGLSIVEDNLTLIAYVNKDIESELHARFDIKGIYREWFNLSDCDLNDIIDKYKFKLCDMA